MDVDLDRWLVRSHQARSWHVREHAEHSIIGRDQNEVIHSYINQAHNTTMTKTRWKGDEKSTETSD